MKDANVSDLIIKENVIRELSKILRDDESIQFATTGFLNRRDILIVLTQTRIILIEKDFKYSVITLDMIDSVIYSRGVESSKISIMSGPKNIIIGNIPREDARVITEKIKNASSTYKTTLLESEIHLASFQNKIDYEIAQIKKYKTLLDDGLITQEEFEAKKKQIMDI